jgi:hypothetical protein
MLRSPLETSTMTRFRRLLPCVSLACSITVSSLSSSLFAQAAPKPAPPKPAAAAPPAAAESQPAAPATQPAAATPQIPENQSLRDDVDDFWHYGKIARYDLAVAFGNKILSRPEPPLEILKTFEKTADDHKDGLDDWMLRWRGLDEKSMQEVANKIEQVLDKGRFAQRSDPKFIEANIQALSSGPRGYANAVGRLRESGEMAVPLMVDYLRDPSKVQYHDAIARALVDLGRTALNPLLAATEMKDNVTLLSVMNCLSGIGYPESVPYLARIAQDGSRPAETRQAAESALRRMGANTGGASVADLFYNLANKFYYNNANVVVDLKGTVAYIWSWTDQGLNYKNVPPATFSDLMAMREARHALELGSGRSDALSLWLAANNKLEVDLPEGATVSVFDKNRPAAAYFNLYAGAQYLNAVLSRSLDDHNSAVALKVIKSLAQIVGPSSQGSGARIDPLVAAMHYPDRLVRFEAAFALANGLPNRAFDGHELVAPLLAEAVAQTGTANLLIIAPSQGDVTKLAGDLKQYGTAGGTTAQQALSEATTLPWVDVIVMAEDLGNQQIDQVYKIASQNARLERATKVILAHTKASPWYQRAVGDPLTIVTTATDAAGIQQAINEARQKGGDLALDEKVASTYATRAADLLQRIAESRSTVFDLAVVQPQLLAALNDKRPEIVKQIADTVAYLNSPAVQPALLTRSLDDKAADEVKIASYKGLANNAKFYGNHLGDQQVADLQKAVESAQNADVRTAAAEARGALNLPADQAKALIIQESKP